MSTDRYTKGVLTVIAVALVTLATQNAVHPSRAGAFDTQSFGGVQKVAICSYPAGPCADIAAGGALTVYDGH